MRSATRRHALAATLFVIATLTACSNPGTPSVSAGSGESAAPSTGASALTITGVEYAFQGVPETAKAGTIVTFTNAGKEFHELIAIRRNDGVTETLEELLAMPEEDSSKFVTFIGPVFAAPGGTADAPITLDQPGSYIFICFIPVGMTELPSEEPSESDPSVGPPHFTQGMVAELVVTE